MFNYASAIVFAIVSIVTLNELVGNEAPHSMAVEYND